MMSRLSKIKSTSGIVDYFAKEDYYLPGDPDHQKCTSWYGSGAKELGLEGVVNSEESKNILEGRLPNGQVIGVQKGSKIVHDPGRQFSFSAPKSVSIISLVYGDERLIEAHNQAVRNTLDEIEKNYLKTRFKKNGEIIIEATGRMVATTIKHELSRDLDPQLHTHVLIANLTSDDKGKWRTAFFDEIFDNHKFLGLIYRSELAKLVKELGYDIQQTGKECLFEIKGVPNELLKLFSKRSETIRSVADKNATSAELERIAVRTRKNKIVSEFDHNLGGEWREEARKLSPNFEKQVVSLSVKKDLEKTHDTPAAQAVDYAIKHLSERKTVFDRKEIILTALNDSLSKTTFSEITKALDLFVEQKELLPVKREGLPKNTYTTATLLDKENSIIKMMLDGKNTHQVIVSNLTKYSDKLDLLNSGQKESASLILTTKDMVTGIQGFAGTGKTTMIKTINEIFREEKQKILGLSPTGVATRNLSSVGNIESMTLQRFLIQYDGVATGRGTKQGRIEMQEKFKDTTVLVDESSMISTNQMKDLLTISNELKFKLILVGDRKQLDSVEAGTPFYEMLRNGMAFTDMRKILRQKTENIKSSVYSVIEGNIDKAFKQLHANIIVTKEHSLTAAACFMAKSPEQRNETIILTPANETREQVNELISSSLYEERIKDEKSKTHFHEIYKNKNLTEAEKTRAYRFQPGDVIHFSKDRDMIKVKKKDFCEVKKINTTENLITIKTGLFSTETFNPIKLKGKAEKNYFEVFENEKRVFYEGDKIAFSRSVPELGIVNSDNAILTKVGLLNFHLKMRDGDKKGKIIKIRKDSLESKLIDHSYAVTAHKAQGLTREHVIAVCESYRKKLTSQKNFYVEISRAEHGLTIIADGTAKVIKRLKENTGVEISAREHQGIEALETSVVSNSTDEKSVTIQKILDNDQIKNIGKTEIQKESPQIITAKNNSIERKYYTRTFDKHEIKDHFLNAIKSAITLSAKDVDVALDNALENRSEKIRFGQKKEYEICWHGEAGYVKSYKTGEYLDWGLNSIKEDRKVIAISKEEAERKQRESNKAREEREKQKLEEEKNIAAKAKKSFEGFFKASSVNTAQNNYLQKKNISQQVIEGVRFTKDDKLVIPLQDAKGQIHSLQFIDSAGKKTFLKGGKKLGNFFMIDSTKVKDSKEIYLAEGFATGVSIHMATNKPVAITFDAGNIEHVLKNLKEIHPTKNFTIAADNDLWKEHNVGREKAEIVAQKFGAKVILPNFSLSHKDELPTDFNDLHKLSGINEVQKQLGHQITYNHHIDFHL